MSKEIVSYRIRLMGSAVFISIITAVSAFVSLLFIPHAMQAIKDYGDMDIAFISSYARLAYLHPVLALVAFILFLLSFSKNGDKSVLLDLSSRLIYHIALILLFATLVLWGVTQETADMHMRKHLKKLRDIRVIEDVGTCDLLKRSGSERKKEVTEQQRLMKAEKFVNEYLLRSSKNGVAATPEDMSKWLCPNCKSVYRDEAEKTQAVWVIPKEKGLGVVVGPLVTCISCGQRSCFTDEGNFLDKIEEKRKASH